MRFPSPVLPDWRPRSELSRPSAEAINRVVNRRATLTYAGPNAVIPIVYGEQIVAGPVIAGPAVSGSTLVYAVALCWAGPDGIERIEDVRLGETITTLGAISNPDSGRTGSVGGVQVQVYDGRQTVVNSQLSSAISGFSDTFEGIAYARVSFSSGANFTNLPEISFRVKGRKCFDPRTSTTAWTENPALHMHDFVTNTDFGMGVGMIGAEAAADMADSMYSGIARARTGLVIQDAMTEEDALALFAEYAEVFWQYDGRDVTVIPDAPVDTIHDISASVIREGSISLSTVGLEQLPTQVRIQFSDRTTPEWPSRPAVAEIPEHTVHGIPVAPSSVELPGVFNRLEAERRAYQRLMRLQAPGRVQWQMFGPGMPYQAGDVVRLPNKRGLQSVAVRLTAQPEMIAPLIYQMAGEIYRENVYPVGAPGVAVPTGAILILRGSGAVPDGWSLLSISDRLIREGAPGNAGSNQTLSATFITNYAGQHTGTRDMSPRGAVPFLFQDGQAPNLYGPYVYINSNPSAPVAAGNHRHSFSFSGQAVQTVRRRGFRFIKRTGASALLTPGICFLSDRSLDASTYYVETQPVNKYLSGSNTEKDLDFNNGRSGNVNGGDHIHSAWQGRAQWDSEAPSRTFRLASAAGAHSHSYSVFVTSKLRSIALAMFESLGDAALPEGAIVGWESGSIPAGWALCDGTNGTVDLSERFIYLTSSDLAGTEHSATSDYSIGGHFSGTAGNHKHTRTFTSQSQINNNPQDALMPYHDSNEGAHSHHIESTSGSLTGEIVNPIRYQLRFIQYIGD